MSDSPTEKNRAFQLRMPLAESRIFVGLIAGLLCLTAVYFDKYQLGPSMMMLVLFAAGIWAKRAWAIYLLIGLLIYLKYFVAVPDFRFGIRRIVELDVVTVMTLVLLAATCFRYLQASRFIDAFYPNTKTGEKRPAELKFQFPSLLGGRWWAIPLSVFLALAMLRFFTFRTRLPGGGNLDPRVSRLIFLTLLLFFAWFVCRALLGIIVRRRMKPEQADVYSRSMVAKEFWKASCDIERRYVKQRKKTIN